MNVDEDFFNQEFENCGHVQREIIKLEDNPPDKRTKEYLVYRDKLNYLYIKYNELGEFKAYKLL